MMTTTMMTGGMIFIIGDDSWAAQRGRRSEMWLDWWCRRRGKFVTQRLLLPPLLALLSSYQPILTHLSWSAQLLANAQLSSV